MTLAILLEFLLVVIFLVLGMLLSVMQHDKHQRKSPLGEKDGPVLSPQQNGILMTRA